MKPVKYSKTDIAIIGMSCRFPGNVGSPAEFWNFLLNGGDGIIPVPEDRWDNNAYFDHDKNNLNKMYVDQGGFIQNIDQFDPQFFGISPKEAPHIDPQHRWLLELTYEAFENAGVKPSTLKGSDTAVFIGQFMHDYEQIQLDSASRKLMTSHSATGPSMTLTANRISYTFDFIGASVTLDTACSSSLVALDMACNAIRNGDSKIAIAGGVNILLRPELTMSICKASMLSPDCRCKSFDASANGYVRSEGAGLVIVKRLSDAQADGNNILAVIKATGVNQDGQTVGITVPNGDSQQKLFLRSLDRANLASDDIQYVEAHGTGTAVGDPIEINALGGVVGVRDSAPCVIGSVKSNIGHTEAAAGMAGLIKTVMAINEGIIPKNIHLNDMNPAIDVKKLNIKIATENCSWPTTDNSIRRALVNSFGFGGTNANVIIEQPPLNKKAITNQLPVFNSNNKLLTISSKTENGLKESAQKYAKYFSGEHNLSADNFDLHDICYTAATKREHHEHRLVIMGTRHEEIFTNLNRFIAGEIATEFISGTDNTNQNHSLCFVFSGMGTQWASMGIELYKTEPVFKDAIDKCSEALQVYTGWSLADEMYNQADSDKIHATYIAQPAIFASQVALSALLKSWNIHPSAIVGHSAGEVAAAYTAGVYSFDDAIKIIFHRSRLQHTTEGTGKMLAVGLSLENVKPYLRSYESQVSVGAINSEDAITLSGEEIALNHIAEELDKDGIFCRFLKVGVPYHSPVMDQLKEPLINALQGITLREPKVKLYSTVSGQLTQPTDWGPEYWADNVREPVNFKLAIENIAADGFKAFLEVSAHPVLINAIEKNLIRERNEISCIAMLKRGENDVAMIHQTLAGLFVNGLLTDWDVFYPNAGQLVSLPNYAWQHASYWNETDEAKHARLSNINRRGGFLAPLHPLLGSQLRSTCAVWQKEIDLNELSYMADHQIDEQIVYPGSGYIEMALAMGHHYLGYQEITLENIEFKRALFLSDKKSTLFECIVDPDSNDYRINAIDPQTNTWDCFSKGVLLKRSIPRALQPISLEKLIRSHPIEVNKSDFYKHCNKLGLTYKKEFQLVSRAWHNSIDCVVEVQIPESILESNDKYLLHPSILDAAFQGLFPTVDIGYLPIGMSELHFYEKPSSTLYCYLVRTYKKFDDFRGNLTIFDKSGKILIEIKNVQLKSTKMQNNIAELNLYDLRWEANAITYDINSNSAQSWIVFADSHGVGEKLIADLTALNHTVYCISEHRIHAHHPDRNYQLLVESAEDIVSVFKNIKHSCHGLIYLWALNNAEGPDAAPEKLISSCDRTSIIPMYLAQAIEQADWLALKAIFFASRSAYNFEPDSNLPDPVQGALWGFGRVLASEFPHINVSMVDLPSRIDAEITHHLTTEVLNDKYEQEIALRHDARYLNRLNRITQSRVDEYTQKTITLSGKIAFQIFAPSLNKLVTQPFELDDLGDHEVLLDIELAEINCTSLINMSQNFSRAIYSCTGVIRNLGCKVTHLNIGDRVGALVDNKLTSMVKAQSSLVQLIPDEVSSRQFCTFASSFILAGYSLEMIARLKSGDWLFICDGASESGLAAIDFAHCLGANIVTTANTEEKIEYLKKKGVAQVFNSRYFANGEEIISATKGKTIDVVFYNSSHIPALKLAKLTAHFGRFVDITRDQAMHKRDFFDCLKQHSITYNPLRFDALIKHCGNSCASLLKASAKALAQFVIPDFFPTAYKVNRSAEILAKLGEADADAEHILLDFNVTDVTAVQGINHQVIKPGRSYLVTGGLGGLGLEVMKWLASKGAESIVLVGRRSPDTSAMEKINLVKNSGVVVTIIQADILVEDDVKEIISTVADSGYPLAGLIHSAGVLSDGIIAQQTREKFIKVIDPKVKGAWHLHQQTNHLNLDFFVCFSSIASIIGWAGQANYAAANAFLDSFSYYRNALGKPTLSINWGPWAEFGMAAHLSARDIQRMNDAGMNALDPANAIKAMDFLLQIRLPQAGVFDIDWKKIIKAYPNPQQKTLLSAFITDKDDHNTNLYDLLREKDAAQRNDLLIHTMKQLLGEVLGIADINTIDVKRNVFEYGMNSLMSMEFKNKIQGLLNVKIPSTLVLKYPTLRLMTSYLLEEVIDFSDASHNTSGQDLILWSPENPHALTSIEINGPAFFTPQVLHLMKVGKSTHFNTGVLLQFNNDQFDLSVLKTALRVTLTYHDACRMQIFPTAAGFKQEIVTLDSDNFLEEFDFSDLPYEQAQEALIAENNRLQESFKFEKGSPLFRIAYYRINDQMPNRLLITFHHFISDALSLRIFLYDLNFIYMKALKQETISAPNKDLSFIQWSEKLNAFSKKDVYEQLPYWRDRVAKANKCRIKKELNPVNTRQPGSLIGSSVEIATPVYKTLLEFAKANHLELGDIILYALIKSFSTITSSNSLWTNLIIHGRSGIFDEIELPKLFGPLAESASILFELSTGDDFVKQIQDINTQRTQVINGGIGLRAIRYLTQDPALTEEFNDDCMPQVILNMDLNDYATETSQGWFGFAREDAGTMTATQVVDNDHPLEFYVNCNIVNGSLAIQVFFFKDSFSKSTVDVLTQRIYALLCKLADADIRLPELELLP